MSFQPAKLTMNWAVDVVCDDKLKLVPYEVPKNRERLPIRKLGPLLPDSAFSGILEVLRGKRWAFFQLPGNVGDSMIEEGTQQLLKRNSIVMSKYNGDIPEWAEGLLLSGGGNIGTIWSYERVRKPHFDQASDRSLPIVILPQSICNPDERIPKNAVVFVREVESLRHCPKARLAPDMAFALTTNLQLYSPNRKRGVFLRSDCESVFGSPFGTDPVNIANGWVEYIRLASENEEVVTDRLHFTMCSILAGRKTTILRNSYHKNQSMWETWLKNMGCLFGTETSGDQ